MEQKQEQFEPLQAQASNNTSDSETVKSDRSTATSTQQADTVTGNQHGDGRIEPTGLSRISVELFRDRVMELTENGLLGDEFITEFRHLISIETFHIPKFFKAHLYAWLRMEV